MELTQAIENDRRIVIQAYSVSPTVEKNIHQALELILSRYDCMEIITPIYTCLKELIVNAVKANFKNIYFENYSPKNNSMDLLGYELALKLFKHELGRENAVYLRKLARENEIWAEIALQVVDESLHIVVTNPVAMTETEAANVQQKMNDAMRFNDISEYFMQVEDDPNREGAGLGLVLITLMLKSLGSADNLSISSDSEKTIASFSINLSRETVERYIS